MIRLSFVPVKMALAIFGRGPKMNLEEEILSTKLALTPAQITTELGQRLPDQYYDDGLGGRVREGRRAIGLTLGQFAFPGCGVSNLSQIERGIHTPQLDLVLKLCLLLDVNPRYLCWGRGSKRLQPERERYILEFLGLPDAELQKLLRKRRKT